ncbi:hypothetical protein OQA88_10592 [Cercophora sp. LCS_1]
MPSAALRPSDGETILNRLQQHAGIWIGDIGALKRQILAKHMNALFPGRFRQDAIATNYFLTDGREISFKRVPAGSIAIAVTSKIETDVPHEHRAKVYHKAFAGILPQMMVPAWARDPALMPDNREWIISRLQKHAKKWIDAKALQESIVRSYYLSHPERVMDAADDPTKPYLLSNGEEVIFETMPIATIVDAVEAAIRSDVPFKERLSIYHTVLRGMPGYQSSPEWKDETPRSKYKEPLTQFSKPRDPDMANRTLLDLLAAAGNFPEEEMKCISCQIVWWDGSSEGEFSCMMSAGQWTISGGRLGRDHTIDDVPVNYFRDRLMDWIAETVKEDTKEVCRKAICPDLTDAEIEEYVRLVAEHREEMNKTPPPPTREEKIQQILDSQGARTYNQALKLVLLYEALNEIDESVDHKTPKMVGVQRNFAIGPKPLDGSVYIPHWGMLPRERELPPQLEVDRDCDQVRAMIKIFCKTSFDWSLDSFRVALGERLTIDQLTKFLQKRGTDAHQLKSAAFLLSWEFFNRRERLGLRLDFCFVQEDRGIVEGDPLVFSDDEDEESEAEPDAMVKEEVKTEEEDEVKPLQGARLTRLNKRASDCVDGGRKKKKRST